MTLLDPRNIQAMQRRSGLMANEVARHGEHVVPLVVLMDEQCGYCLDAPDYIPSGRVVPNSYGQGVINFGFGIAAPHFILRP